MLGWTFTFPYQLSMGAQGQAFKLPDEIKDVSDLLYEYYLKLTPKYVIRPFIKIR